MHTRQKVGFPVRRNGGHPRFHTLGCVLIGIVFSLIGAVLTYYGAVAPVFRNRVVASLVGVAIGSFFGVAAYFDFSNPSDDEERQR